MLDRGLLSKNRENFYSGVFFRLIVYGGAPMICPKCNNMIPDDATVCNICGYMISDYSVQQKDQSLYAQDDPWYQEYMERKELEQLRNSAQKKPLKNFFNAGLNLGGISGVLAVLSTFLPYISGGDSGNMVSLSLYAMSHNYLILSFILFLGLIISSIAKRGKINIGIGIIMLIIYLYRYGVFDNVRMEFGDSVRYGYGNYVFLFAAIIAIVSGIVIYIRNRDKD